MERRDFVKNCSMLCFAGIGLSMLLDSCGAVYYATSNILHDKIVVNKIEFIDSRNIQRKFIVVKSEKLQFPICLYKNGANYTALYMQCPHQGCELNPNQLSLVCPCHGSEFSILGKVQSPPADADLKIFNTTTDNENIYIQL